MTGILLSSTVRNNNLLTGTFGRIVAAGEMPPPPLWNLPTASLDMS